MKERLTGAIILVAVLVLLVPELLSGPGEGLSTSAEGAESSAALRSYTIDLADDASRRATAPTSAATVATDEPVATAIPEPEDAGADEGGADAAASVGSGSAVASRGDGDRASGSGADRAAATSPGSASTDATKVDGNAARGASPSPEDDQPRSAFGPNAVQRPKAVPPTESPRAEGTAAAKVASGDSASSRSRNSESARPAASDSKVTKGWAVQLGVFASRDNADRLAKQVKGKGYTVSVNETSGSGKRLYRVRVGPEASRPAAVELGAKLRAAGYSGSVVSYP